MLSVIGNVDFIKIYFVLVCKNYQLQDATFFNTWKVHTDKLESDEQLCFNNNSMSAKYVPRVRNDIAGHTTIFALYLILQ